MEILLVTHLAFGPESARGHKDSCQKEHGKGVGHLFVAENNLYNFLLICPKRTELIVNLFLSHELLLSFLLSASLLCHVICMVT